MKRGMTLFVLSFLVYGVVAWSYIFHANALKTLDARLSDLFFKIRGDRPTDSRIAIIDIDEKSLAHLGRWPWPRSTIAKILDTVHRYGATIVALDMVFAEKSHFYQSHMSISKEDQALARILDHTPTITGIFIDFTHENIRKDQQIPAPKAIYIEKNRPNDFDPIPHAASIIANIPILQRHALSYGFVNTIPDRDGIVRRLPLLVRYRHLFYPALSFETVRLLSGSDTVKIDYSQAGVDKITTGPVAVETDRHGQMRLNYRSGERRYHYISAIDLYNGTIDPQKINGKILIFGSSAAGLLDLRATPLAASFPGVEIQATAIDNLIHRDYLLTPDWIEGAELAGMAFITLAFWLLFLFAEPLIATAIGGLTVIGWYYLAYRIFLDHHIVVNVLFPLLLMIELIFILGLFNHYYESKIKRTLRDKFAKKVSPQVLEDLMRNANNEKRVIRKEVVTIFFSDIRNFTTMGEKMKDAKKLVDFLNRYMTPMTQIIIEEKGTVDKFIGDAIMAYWNAPLPVDNHEERAVRTALHQIEILKKLNDRFAQEHLPPIEIGIGIHTGEAVVGEMGSEGRSDYTIIGDSVNLASRIEALNKIYGTTILISESTMLGLRDRSKARLIDRVKVKGKEDPVDIYEIVVRPITKEERQLHAKALRRYHEGDPTRAAELFTKLYERYRHPLYAHFIKRCEEAAKSPDGYQPILVLRR